jgi:heme a synthase
MSTTSKNIWLHRFAIFTALSTSVLIYWGGLVTSTGSGLAVPDWPLSYGMLMPPMVGGIFYEHGHRMVATFVGLLTIILAFWIQKKEVRSWMKVLGWSALGIVVFQGILGGITVLFFLPTAVSVFHATVAQTFFCVTISIALFTSPFWKNTREGSLKPAATLSLRTLTVLLTGTVYLQLIVGAIMRHMQAGLAIPDFPLAFGKVIPPFDSADIIIHFLHRTGALLVTGLILWVFIHVLRHYRKDSALLIPVTVLVSLTVIQITLGGFVIWSGKSIAITTFHVVTGALILGTSAYAMLLSRRLIIRQANQFSVEIASQQVRG